MIYLEQLDGSNVDIFQPFIPESLQVQALSDDGFTFLGMVSDDIACGIIALHAVGDTAVLKYMYLLPDWRSRGHIDSAISMLLVNLYQEGYAYVQMDYIPSEYPQIAKLADRFSFRKYTTDRSFFSFKISEIMNCKAMSYTAQGILRLRALPSRIKDDLFKLMDKSGYDISRKTIENDPETLEQSLVYMEGEKPRGLLLVKRFSRKEGPGGVSMFGKVFPSESSADIALIYVGSKELKVPLYLLSALCRNFVTDFAANELVTGYFPEGHITRLLEGALGVRGQHEETAILDLSTMQRFLEDDDPELFIEEI